MLLPKGLYHFSTSVACDQRIFRGPNCPISIKLWGGEEQAFESERKDAQHLDLTQTFLIPSETPEEILIQCQAHSSDSPLEFDFTNLALLRLE